MDHLNTLICFRAIGISFMGTFGSESPTQAALEAAQNLIAMGVAHGYISKDYHLYGHRQAVATLCPGDKLFSIIQGWKNFTPGSAKWLGVLYLGHILTVSLAVPIDIFIVVEADIHLNARH